MGRFGSLGAALGQGFTAGAMPHLQQQQQLRLAQSQQGQDLQSQLMRNKLQALTGAVPQAQQLQDAVKGLGRQGLGALGLAQPLQGGGSGNPLTNLLMTMLTGQLDGGGGGNTVRVKDKGTGATGRIPWNEFDSAKYERIGE